MGIYFALENLLLLPTVGLEENLGDATVFLQTTLATGIK